MINRILLLKQDSGFNADPSPANKASLMVLAGLVNAIYSEVVYDQIESDLVERGVLQKDRSNKQDVIM